MDRLSIGQRVIIDDGRLAILESGGLLAEGIATIVAIIDDSGGFHYTCDDGKCLFSAWPSEVTPLVVGQAFSREEKMKPEWPDRQKLYRVIDSEGENFFVQADSFSEAEAKFLKWDAGVEADYHDEAIESIMDAGYLIRDSVPRV